MTRDEKSTEGHINDPDIPVSWEEAYERVVLDMSPREPVNPCHLGRIVAYLASALGVPTV